MKRVILYLRYATFILRYGYIPARAIVRMHWEDGENTDKGLQEDIIALEGFNEDAMDDERVLFYCGYENPLDGLLELMRPHNGSDFIVDQVISFY